MMTFDALFTRHVGLSVDKQLCLAEVVGDLRWSFDMDAGKLHFGTTHSFDVQILGTQSDHSQTWLWAWANEQSGIPKPLLRAVGRILEYGRQHGVTEFTTPEIPINHDGGHRLALVATGLVGADCYYRGPYEGGAVFLLLNGAEPVRRKASVSAQHLVNSFLQAISSYEVKDQRAALEAYLRVKGYVFTSTADVLVATRTTGERLSAEFDSLARLSKMTADIKPSPRRPWWKLWSS